MGDKNAKWDQCNIDHNYISNRAETKLNRIEDFTLQQKKIRGSTRNFKLKLTELSHKKELP